MMAPRLAFAAIGLLLGGLMLAGGAAAAEVQPFGRGSYAMLRHEHAGKPLAINFWSLTCAPCIAELPRLAAFKARHPEVALILVSTDPIEQAPALSARLARFGLADAPSYAFADSFVLRLMFEVSPDWRGEMPRTSLIGPKGEAESVLGMVEDADLEAWLTRVR